MSDRVNFVARRRPWPEMAWGLAICLLLAARGARAADTPAEQATLKGLSAVRVVVDASGGKGIPRELQPTTLEAEIASRLRAADIGQLGADERAQGQPTLCLTLLMFVDDSGEERMATYACELSLVQETRLARQPGVRIAAPTWRAPLTVASVPAAELHKLRDAIHRDVERFVAAWRAANAP